MTAVYQQIMGVSALSLCAAVTHCSSLIMVIRLLNITADSLKKILTEERDEP